MTHRTLELKFDSKLSKSWVPPLVTRIEGSTVTIKDGMGVEQTVEPKNPEALTTIKVGDQAAVEHGVLTKGGGAEPSAPSRGGGY